MQLLEHLLRVNVFKGGFAHHPIIDMWRGYERALAWYGSAICLEWRHRGYRDTLMWRFRTYMYDSPGTTDLPPWWGDDEVHASHRSNLLRKLPEHYRRFWSDEPDNLFYRWAVNHDDGSYSLRYSRADAQRLARLG